MKKRISLTATTITNQQIANWLYLVLVSLLTTTAWALDVSHQVRPNADFLTSSLNFSCSTWIASPVPYRCNPALFPFAEGEGVTLTMVGKSDGDSIDNGRDLIFKPISESLIRRLFQESSFSSFSFNSNIAFKTKYFDLSYSPYYLLADLFLFNPAFPEISLNLVNRESLQVTSGVKSESFKLSADGQTNFVASLGGDLFYYEHGYENTMFSLFDLSFRRPEELISLKTETGVSGNLGFLLKNNSLFIPDLSLQVRNIESKIKPDSRAEVFRQKNSYLFETYSSLGVGKGYQTLFGGIDLNVELPFSGYYEIYNLDFLTFGGRYNLRLFTFSVAWSELYQNFGLKFNSTTFDVGLFYAKERDLTNLKSVDQQSVYTGVDIKL